MIYMTVSMMEFHAYSTPAPHPTPEYPISLKLVGSVKSKRKSTPGPFFIFSNNLVSFSFKVLCYWSVHSTNKRKANTANCRLQEAAYWKPAIPTMESSLLYVQECSLQQVSYHGLILHGPYYCCGEKPFTYFDKFLYY